MTNIYLTFYYVLYVIIYTRFYHYLGCPRSEQTRFEDNCFEYAISPSPIPANIFTNIDACKEKGSELWVPESSAEHYFVKQNFPGTEDTHEQYHLGILKYSNQT